MGTQLDVALTLKSAIDGFFAPTPVEREEEEDEMEEIPSEETLWKSVYRSVSGLF